MKESIFMKRGNLWKISSKEEMNIYNELPGGVYTLVNIPFQGLMLEQTDEFKSTKKVYGNYLALKDRIWNTFKSRDCSTGVLLYGEKGSGKSLLTKLISEHGVKNNVPTIIINSPFQGEEFSMFIQSLPDDTIVVFDEFEKVYPTEEDQNPILSILDGMYNSKKMFVFTINEIYKINNYMINRPSRIFYKIKFDGLDKSFVEEYCSDNLANKHYTPNVVNIVEVTSKFNFDMLQCLVEEMNRYNESPAECLRYLNISRDSDTMYQIVDITSSKYKINSDFSKHQPMTLPLDKPNALLYFDFERDAETDEEKEDSYYKKGEYPDNFTMKISDFQMIDKATGYVVFKNNEFIVRMKRFEQKDYGNWLAV